MDLNDVFCIKIKRFGALGLEEKAGHLHLHAVERSEVEVWLNATMGTLGPGDRAEITITRGHQTEDAAKAATLYEQLAEPAPVRSHGGVHDAPLPGDDHPSF